MKIDKETIIAGKRLWDTVPGPVKDLAPLCRKIAAEGSVLLKNDNVLPFKKGEKIAVFGRIQETYIKSGTGSGGLVNVEQVPCILTSLRENGIFEIDETLALRYVEWIEEHPFDNGHGWATEPWCQEEMAVDCRLAEKAASRNDAAVIIIGRTAGEDKDNSTEKGSYYLTGQEEEMIANVTAFFDRVAVILNVDADHLDFFKDLEDVEHSFRRFAELVPADTGVVVADRDDQNTMETLAGLERPLITFGLEEGDVHAAGLEWVNGFPSFDIVFRGEKVTRVELQVPGEHNVRNALAAAAAALALRVPVRGIREGLGAFRGAGRRFEHKGTYRGAQVYDDYAHHPEELRALLTMAQSLGYGRVICAFQPHTYSRTHELFSDFVEVLKLPDQVLLAEIFAAREQNELGISSRDLAEQIPGAEFCPGVEQVAERLAQLAQPGDLILTVGAGDIFRAGELLLAGQEKGPAGN